MTSPMRPDKERAKAIENELTITLADVVFAARWAREHKETPGLVVAGQERRYEQGDWDCGTSCCVWGAAHLRRLGKPAWHGPLSSWCQQSEQHRLVAGLLRDLHATPEAIELAAAEYRGVTETKT